MGQQMSRHGDEDQPFDYNLQQQQQQQQLHHLLLMGVSNSGKTSFCKMSNLLLGGSMSKNSLKFHEELLSSMFSWLLFIICVKKKIFNEIDYRFPSSKNLIDEKLLKIVKISIVEQCSNEAGAGENENGGEQGDASRCLLQQAIVKPELLWSDAGMMQQISMLWATETILHKIYTILYYNKISPELLYLFGNTQVGSIISGNVLDKNGNVNTVPKQPQWQHFEHFNYVITHCNQIAERLRRARKGFSDTELKSETEYLLASNMTRGFYESEIKIITERKSTSTTENATTSTSSSKKSKDSEKNALPQKPKPIIRSLHMIDSAGVRSDRKKWKKILLSKLYEESQPLTSSTTSSGKDKEKEEKKKKKSENTAPSSSSVNASSTPLNTTTDSNTSANSSEQNATSSKKPIKTQGVAILYFVSLTCYNQYSVDDILGLYGSTISITDSRTPGSPLVDKVLTLEKPVYESGSDASSNDKLISTLTSPTGSSVNVKHTDLLEKERAKKKTLKSPKFKPLIDSASSNFLSRHQSLQHNHLLTLKNQLIDSLEFFNRTVNMPELEHVPFILVFTKKESLKRKLVYCDLSDAYLSNLLSETPENFVRLDPFPEEIMQKRTSKIDPTTMPEKKETIQVSPQIPPPATPEKKSPIPSHLRDEDSVDSPVVCMEKVETFEEPKLSDQVIKPATTRNVTDESSSSLDESHSRQSSFIEVSIEASSGKTRRFQDNRCVSVSINLSTLEQQLESQRKQIKESLTHEQSEEGITQEMIDSCLKFNNPPERIIPLTEDDLKEPEQSIQVTDEYLELNTKYIIKQFLNQVSNDEKRNQIQIVTLDVFNREDMKKLLAELVNKSC
ncbi:predicted protein [Naegleria gruberi]|uniref:Predicted protein n=1 Tax=Naegleria gruberi TaxID=5762 RepID=D2VVS8_NAEGR|nr:uncharacterized protein NAEGRDRAFT_81415 [Naegleria gruberi]EFC39160.1 predicted protein [Naegleria gruberi]|eukprot:XP_002671904.1 predicted protein [Naegleria gruberi strain NEG-M]